MSIIIDNMTDDEVTDYETQHEVNLTERSIFARVRPLYGDLTPDDQWYRIALDTAVKTVAVDVRGVDALRKLRDACNVALAEVGEDGARPPLDTDEDRLNTELVDVGGMHFSFCTTCGQPSRAARAAVESFAFIDQLQAEMHVVAEKAREVAARARMLARSDGGYDGLHDPFNHWTEQGGEF